MTNPRAIQTARAHKREVTEKLWDRYVVNEPFVATDSEIAERLRVDKEWVRTARPDLAELGCISTTKTHRQGAGRGLGWTTTWTLLVPKGTALAKLDARWRKDDEETDRKMQQPNPAKGRRPGGAAPTNGHTNGHLNGATPEHPVLPPQLVAVMGPEPARPMAAPLAPERKDESYALVEAARQYATTQRELDNKVKELESLGVQVDRNLISKAIRAPQDHTLTIVAKVLPYIEQIERQNQRLMDANGDLREKALRLQTAEETSRRQHDQIERLVRETANLREQLNGRVPARPAAVPNASAPAE